MQNFLDDAEYVPASIEITPPPTLAAVIGSDRIVLTQIYCGSDEYKVQISLVDKEFTMRSLVNLFEYNIVDKKLNRLRFKVHTDGSWPSIRIGVLDNKWDIIEHSGGLMGQSTEDYDLPPHVRKVDKDIFNSLHITLHYKV